MPVCGGCGGSGSDVAITCVSVHTHACMQLIRVTEHNRNHCPNRRIRTPEKNEEEDFGTFLFLLSFIFLLLPAFSSKSGARCVAATSSSFLCCRRDWRTRNATRVASCTSPLPRSGRGDGPAERGRAARSTPSCCGPGSARTPGRRAPPELAVVFPRGALRLATHPSEGCGQWPRRAPSRPSSARAAATSGDVGPPQEFVQKPHREATFGHRHLCGGCGGCVYPGARARAAQ